MKGTKTHKNLLDAFSGECQAFRRYQYFARQADIEGYPDVAGVFRDIAEGEAGHGSGHLGHLVPVGDPATGLPLGSTMQNLTAAIEGELYESSEMYTQFARTAREEGFDAVAEWFDTLARAERLHAIRLQQALDSLR